MSEMPWYYRETGIPCVVDGTITSIPHLAAIMIGRSIATDDLSSPVDAMPMAEPGTAARLLLAPAGFKLTVRRTVVVVLVSPGQEDTRKYAHGREPLHAHLSHEVLSRNAETD